MCCNCKWLLVIVYDMSISAFIRNCSLQMKSRLNITMNALFKTWLLWNEQSSGPVSLYRMWWLIGNGLTSLMTRAKYGRLIRINLNRLFPVWPGNDPLIPPPIWTSPDLFWTGSDHGPDDGLEHGPKHWPRNGPGHRDQAYGWACDRPGQGWPITDEASSLWTDKRYSKDL